MAPSRGIAIPRHCSGGAAPMDPAAAARHNPAAARAAILPRRGWRQDGGALVAEAITGTDSQRRTPFAILRRWAAMPLYLQILIGLVLGVITGLVLGPRAGWMD